MHHSLAPRLVTALAACGALLHASPQQQGTFRGATELVAVYATVTDASGRLMPDLEQTDFEVRDNGKVQPIVVFSSAVQPITVVIMLDRSGSMMSHSDVIAHSAQKFVERLLPADRARIGDFSKAIRIHPEAFTSDPAELIGLIRTSLQNDSNGPSPVWTALDRAVAAVGGEPGRRVVLFFSDGRNEPGYDQRDTKFDDARRRALDAEVMVYSIGVPAQVPAGGAVILGRPIGFGSKFVAPDKKLRQIAEETGGGFIAFDWAQNLNEAFTRVADELHRQYLIGFAPAKSDGKTHKIEVVAKKPGLTARARKSYVAAAR
jgi:Ca-activated chloride channel homolog